MKTTLRLLLVPRFLIFGTVLSLILAGKSPDATSRGVIKESMAPLIAPLAATPSDIPMPNLQIIPPSPEAQTIQRYIDHEITEYNGLAKIEIPLYEIKVKGLTIPITLSYHAGGVKYGDFGGDLGVGWSINAGGYRVNRTVKGLDDFTYDKIDMNEYQTLLDDLDTSKIKASDIDAFLASMTVDPDGYMNEYYIIPNRNTIDGEYDIFSYMIPASTGQFLITSRGYESTFSPVIKKIENNTDHIKVENDKNIIITDGSGFRYYFGGSDDQQQFLERPNLKVPISPTSWALRQIVSPFSDKIDFKYEKHAISTDLTQAHQTIIEPFYGTDDRMVADTAKLREYQDGLNYDTFYIDRIITDDVEVVFVREEGYKQIKRRIKEIVVTDRNKNATIRRFVFDYEDENVWSAYILKSVTIHSTGEPEQKYDLSYYKPVGATHYLFPDQWGYNKSHISPTGQNRLFFHNEFRNDVYLKICRYDIGSITSETVGRDGISAAIFDRSSNDQEAIHYYSLKRITFPTGGYTEYEYEPHKYLSSHYRGVVVGGGQRIEKIRSVSSDGEDVTTVFKYGEKEDGIGVCNIDLNETMFANETHILNYAAKEWVIIYPSGHLDVLSLLPGVWTLKNYYTQPINGIDYSMFQVRYPEVATYQMEEQGIPIGKTVSNYAIQREYDTEGMYAGAEGWSTELHPFHENNGGYVPNTTVVHRPGHRPLLKGRTLYNKNGLPIMKEIYDYKDSGMEIFTGLKSIRKVYFDTYYELPNNDSPYKYVGSAFNYMPYMVITGGSILSEKTTTTYSVDGTMPFSVSEKYEYNDRNQLTKKTTLDVTADHRNVVEEYTYPTVSNTALYQKNMLSTILKKEVTDGSGTTFQRERYSYPSNAILPDYAEGLNSRKEVIYNSHDSKGNLLQYTRLDGVPVSYVWSYNYKYPVAEIVNKTYAQVSAALNVNMTALAANPNPDVTTINRLKALKDVFPDASVTVYTYKPLVGILTATDPRGFTVYYDYDSLGRLKETYILKNGVKQKVEGYNYNYINK